MQNVQRVVFERDHALVRDYWERGKTDKEDLAHFERLQKWFEDKWGQEWTAETKKQGFQR